MVLEQASDIGFYIKQIHDRLEKRANNAMRAGGLTMMQLTVLLRLQQAEGKQLSMKELERLFGVAQSTVAGIVSRLEQKGFVEALGDASDKRVKLVHITPTGEGCCAEAALHKDKTEHMLLLGFTDKERDTFAELLKKALNNIG